jgi:mono/diheme cytochrome c family protein/tetratricopeptide (TPR) repeat protein
MLPTLRRDPASGPSSRSWKSLLLSVLLILLVAAIVVVAGGSLIRGRVQNLVVDRIERGMLHESRRSLVSGDRRLAESTEGKLLLARIYRHADRRHQWESILSSIDASIARDEIRLERRLGAIRWGLDRPASDDFSRLVRQGVQRDDAAVTILLGLLASASHTGAERLLQQWEADGGWPAQIAWGRGLYHLRRQEYATARSHLERSLEIEPQHDNALIGLAETLERLNEPKLAAEHFSRYLERWSGSVPALLGLSRCKRRLGHADVAAEITQQLVATENPSQEAWLEAAEVAYFLGNFSEAVARFEETDLDGPQLSATIRTAATAYALAGQPSQAEALFNRYLAGHSVTFRRQVLEQRIREDPSDRQAVEELRQIMTGELLPLAERPKPPPAISALFSEHCSTCHGDAGRGDGPANRHLYPAARDLHGDAYRLVTTLNRFPSKDDIRAVIRDGIAGTSMQAFTQLSDAEIDQLVEETYRLRQLGFRSNLVASFQLLGDQLDEEAIDNLVHQSGSSGAALVIPAWPSAGPDDVAAGESLFRRAACNHCHGVDEGSGQGRIPLADERGNPTVARNLMSDSMKGGSDRAALFARLRLGMPGTPHPANPTFSDDEIIHLVEYCLAIARQPTRQLTNHQRAVEANARIIDAFRSR